MFSANASQRSRRWLWGAAAAVTMALGGCAATSPTAVQEGARARLAPTGTLRVAVYPGSPTSLVEQAPVERMRGVSVDMDRLLAGRLGVPVQIVVYPRLAEALAALQRGDADFTITNATADRARILDFAPTLVDLELGVLVTSNSRVRTIAQLDQPGVTVGVSQGSSSERVLGDRLKVSAVRSFPTIDAVRAALQGQEIDAYATNKGILFELAQRVPGSRVLDGRWGAEHLAPAVPKGRDSGMPYLREFTESVRRSGELERASSRAGLRGTVPPAP